MKALNWGDLKAQEFGYAILDEVVGVPTVH